MEKNSKEEKNSFWTTLPGILTGFAALITAIGGLILAANQLQKAAATPTITPIIFTATNTEIPNNPIEEATSTPVNTATPSNNTLPSGLSENCINGTIWKPFTDGGSYTKDSNGCWQLLKTGFTANNDNLQLAVENSRSTRLRGIYRPIPENADIEFKLTMKNFSSGENDPKILGLFGIGISGINVNSPEKTILYYRALNTGEPINVLLGNWGFADFHNLGINFVSGITQQVKFLVQGDTLQIFLDDTSVSSPVDITAMGPEKGLYIVYSLLSTNKLTVSLSDFIINGK